MATCWVLGDQFHRHRGSLANAPDRVHVIDARGFPIRKPYHPEKLALVFSAMRHAQDELADFGTENRENEAGTGPAALRPGTIQQLLLWWRIGNNRYLVKSGYISRKRLISFEIPDFASK